MANAPPNALLTGQRNECLWKHCPRKSAFTEKRFLTRAWEEVWDLGARGPHLFSPLWPWVVCPHGHDPGWSGVVDGLRRCSGPSPPGLPAVPKALGLLPSCEKCQNFTLKKKLERETQTVNMADCWGDQGLKYSLNSCMYTENPPTFPKLSLELTFFSFRPVLNH